MIRKPKSIQSLLVSEIAVPRGLGCQAERENDKICHFSKPQNVMARGSQNSQDRVCPKLDQGGRAYLLITERTR
jgi:hypothetical protein